MGQDMKRVLAVSAVALLASAQANAADMYRPSEGGYKDGPAYATANWAGFYAGVNGGGAWANNKQLVDYYFHGLSPAGGFGGGQIGYNLQGFIHPQLVLGVEADIQGSGISAKGADGALPYKSDLDYFGTVRGRAGYAVDRALVYFTGGFAYGGLRKASQEYAMGDQIQTNSGFATGYLLGGGLEYQITPVWSVKAEYQYMNFGKNDVCGGGGPDCFSAPNAAGPQKDDDYRTVRIGVNYHVQPGFEPLK